MLGLQGAGKTTIMKQLTDSMESSKGVSPTAGFFVTTMERCGVTLNIWEGILPVFYLIKRLDTYLPGIILKTKKMLPLDDMTSNDSLN